VRSSAPLLTALLRSWSRLETALLRTFLRLPPRSRKWVGLAFLLVAAWCALNGQLWSFTGMEHHRFTSRAILTGVLWMRGTAALAGHDEQVYGGAVFTNWGFGVPLLQVPFHAFAGWTHLLSGFFPDRTIYFVYLTATVPILWAGLDRLLATRPSAAASPSGRMAVSWAATFLVLSWALFPLMSRRFIVYEETVAYLILAQLAALGAYVFACTSPRVSPAIAMGIAAGIGLLVRPTGLVYLGVWGALLVLDRHGRKALAFLAAAAPFVAFWLYSNWVKTGSPVGLGFNNSNPYFEYHTGIVRFGSSCADTPVHALQIALRLFVGLFFFTSAPSAGSWAQACHYEFEERDPTHEPILGPVVLALLGWMVYRYVARRERRLAAYLPYAAMAVLFVNFTRAGIGFAWRYAGDFWPLVVLAVVDYVRVAPVAGLRPMDLRLAKVLFLCGLVVFTRFLVPWEWGWHVESFPASAAPRMWDDFAASRWPSREPLPGRISCDALPSAPYHNGLGWRDGCAIGTFTNVYLGVVAKSDDHYELRIETDGMTPAPLAVYVNGRLYTPVRDGATYRADVTIHHASLTSPVVIATVEWAREVDPSPPGHLLSIELA